LKSEDACALAEEEMKFAGAEFFPAPIQTRRFFTSRNREMARGLHEISGFQQQLCFPPQKFKPVRII
jgi:hypothetical protein